MRIAIFSQYSGCGGAERVSSILANEFCIENRVYYCSFRNNGYYNLHESIEKRVFESKKPFALLHELISFFKKEHIDVVYAIGTPAAGKIAFAKFLGRCKFLFIASERNDPANEARTFIKRRLRSWSYNKADSVIFQTEDAKHYFSKKIQKKAAVILNPLVFDNLKTVNIDGEYGRIIAVGRISKQKNFPLLIRAFSMFSSQFPDYVLDIYGNVIDNLEYNLIIELIKKLKLENKVFIKGFSKVIINELAKSSIYVSSSNYEGISNSMLEAMAVGLPVVCTDCPCGGTRMIVQDGYNGVLVPPGDENALYLGMRKIAFDRDFAQLISNNAKTIVSRCDAQSVSKQWITIAKNLINNTKK